MEWAELSKRTFLHLCSLLRPTPKDSCLAARNRDKKISTSANKSFPKHDSQNSQLPRAQPPRPAQSTTPRNNSPLSSTLPLSQPQNQLSTGHNLHIRFSSITKFPPNPQVNTNDPPTTHRVLLDPSGDILTSPWSGILWVAASINRHRPPQGDASAASRALLERAVMTEPLPGIEDVEEFWRIIFDLGAIV